jgi:hypothetical protein
MSPAGFEQNPRKRGASDLNLRTRYHWDCPLETDLTYVGKEEIALRWTHDTYSLFYFLLYSVYFVIVSIYIQVIPFP